MSFRQRTGAYSSIGHRLLAIVLAAFAVVVSLSASARRDGLIAIGVIVGISSIVMMVVLEGRERFWIGR